MSTKFNQILLFMSGPIKKMVFTHTWSFTLQTKDLSKLYFNMITLKFLQFYSWWLNGVLDLLEDLLWLLRPINFRYSFAVVLYQGFGLRVVSGQATLQSLRIVVGSTNERLPGDVVLSRRLRRTKIFVVGSPGCRMDPPAGDSLEK